MHSSARTFHTSIGKSSTTQEIDTHKRTGKRLVPSSVVPAYKVDSIVPTVMALSKGVGYTLRESLPGSAVKVKNEGTRSMRERRVCAYKKHWTLWARL